MTKRAMMVAIVVSALFVPVLARAGAKFSQTVVVSSTYGYGNVGAARSSSDSNEYIGCTTYYNAGNSGSTIAAFCFAENSAGTFFYCQTTTPNVLQVIGTITDASYIDIGAANNGGQCTYVEVDNYSYYAPMTP